MTRVSIATKVSHVHCHLHMAKFHALLPPWRSKHTLPTMESPGERTNLPPRALQRSSQAHAEQFPGGVPLPLRLPHMHITNGLRLYLRVSAMLAPGEIPRAHSLDEEQILGLSFVESPCPVPCQQGEEVCV